MVAGCRLWGEDEQQSADHQPGGGGQLGVEALLEHRGRTGEERGLRAGVEPGRPVDQEDQDRPCPGRARKRPARGGSGGCGRRRCRAPRRAAPRHQQVGVGVDRGPRPRPSARRRLRAARRSPARRPRPRDSRRTAMRADIAAAATITAQVARSGVSTALPRVEARTAQAAARRVPRSATPSRRRKSTPTGRRRRPVQRASRPARAWTGLAQRSSRSTRPSTAGGRRPAAAAASGSARESDPVDPAVDPPRPPPRQLRQRVPARPRRCYHRASLSLGLLHGLPRARKGLFLAPIPVFAGRLLFRSSPLHLNTFTLRPCHEASL